MVHAALQSVLSCGNLPAGYNDWVKFIGSDPVFRTRYRVGTVGAAALAAIGIVIAILRDNSADIGGNIEIDVRAAAASLRSYRYVRIDGLGSDPFDPLTGFYPTADSRLIYFHCNLPPHRQAMLRALGVEATRECVTSATRTRNGFEIEQLVDAAGGCAMVVRTPEEWRDLPNTAFLKSEPLVNIRKIGDSDPIPLPAGELPLSGIRVLDLTRVLAGPTCARLLAEYGSDVVKIACERHPDPPAIEMDTCYGKRFLTLDLALSESRLQLESLVRGSDVFVQAYRLGAIAALGFSPGHVASLRPGIVYASLNAFGHTGPWRGRRGFDTVVQSGSGMAYVQGGRREPAFIPVSALDYVTGYLLTFGVLVALRRRAAEGGSYAVDVSLARTSEWIESMGLLDQDALDAASEEVTSDELARWLVEVPTPRGLMTRMRPVIGYSDGWLADLPPWRTQSVKGTAWLG